MAPAETPTNKTDDEARQRIQKAFGSVANYSPFVEVVAEALVAATTQAEDHLRAFDALDGVPHKAQWEHNYDDAARRCRELARDEGRDLTQRQAAFAGWLAALCLTPRSRHHC